MIKINGKEYRNIQEQVAKNQEDIEELQETISIDAYTKEEADEKFRTIDDSYSKSQSNSTFVSKAALTDYSINDIIVADSEIQSGSVELKAVSSQDVMSEVSLDPSSVIVKTTSGLNNSTIGVSGTEVTVTTGILKYNGSEVVTSANTYSKTEVDNKDTAALNAAKAYTDTKVIAGASVYEYELIFTETDHNTTWHFIFNSTDGTLVNTSVPEDYSELCQFVTDFGIPEILPGTGLTSHMHGFVGSYTNPRFAILYMYTSGSTDVIQVSDGDTFTGFAIDANNLDTNSIKLLKRTI